MDSGSRLLGRLPAAATHPKLRVVWILIRNWLISSCQASRHQVEYATGMIKHRLVNTYDHCWEDSPTGIIHLITCSKARSSKTGLHPTQQEAKICERLLCGRTQPNRPLHNCCRSTSRQSLMGAVLYLAASGYGL